MSVFQSRAGLFRRRYVPGRTVREVVFDTLHANSDWSQGLPMPGALLVEVEQYDKRVRDADAGIDLRGRAIFLHIEPDRLTPQGGRALLTNLGDLALALREGSIDDGIGPDTPIILATHSSVAEHARRYGFRDSVPDQTTITPDYHEEIDFALRELGDYDGDRTVHVAMTSVARFIDRFAPRSRAVEVAA